MMAAGRVIRMGLSASCEECLGTVRITVNGQVKIPYSVTKPEGQFTGIAQFSTPLELREGDRINFISSLGNAKVSCAIVSILIELDI